MGVPLLLITGTVGVGKTAVASKVSDILCARDVPHAFVDLDALSNSWPPQGRFNEELTLKNLATVWANFSAAGAERLVVSGVVESRAELRRYAEAVPAAAVIVCRLVASEETRASRLRSRESGAALAWHLKRTVELERILEQAVVEAFRVENDGPSLEAVACEVIERAGWNQGQIDR